MGEAAIEVWHARCKWVPVMTVALVVLLVLHALLHLLGFLKSYGLAELPALSGQTLVPLEPPWPRIVGLLWLLTTLVLLGAAAMRALRVELWWVVALTGVVVSQLLIVLQWQDAKAGSVANVLIVIAIARALFEVAQRE